MSSSYQGEYPTNTAMSVYWRHDVPFDSAPSEFGYAAPTLSEGTGQVDIWRRTATSVTQVITAQTATVAGSQYGWVSCSYSYTPTAVGYYTAYFAYDIGGLPGWGVTEFSVYESGTDTATGKVISLFVYERPEVTHVVHQTLDGAIVARQDPS